MSIKKVFAAIIKKSTVKDAFGVSFIVGIILNVVNQGDVLFSLEFGNLSILKLILTFIVPYLVSTYSSVRTRLSLNLEEECANFGSA